MRTWLERLYEDAAAGRLAPGHHPVFRVLIECVHIAVVLVRETMRDRLHVRAAMLAYWSSVAIVPILLLGFAMTGPMGLAADTRDAVRRLLYDTVLASSVEEVGQALDSLLLGANLGTLGVLGVLGIMLIGAQLFFNAELAYNDIFRTRVRRSRILRFTLFYAGLTLGPLLLASGFLLTAKMGDVPGSGLLHRALPLILTATLLVAALRLLPCSQVSWKAALSGGLLSAVAFELAKAGFGAYTELFGTTDNMTRIYGGLAFLPVFLLWLYVSWLVVLFGVEVAYLVQHHGSLVDAQRRLAVDRHALRRQPDGFFALAVMATVSEHYLSGRGGMGTEQISVITGTDPRHVQGVLEVLEDADLLVRSEHKHYLPARPPADISGTEVLRAWRELATPQAHGPAAGAVRIGIGAVEGMLAAGLDVLSGCQTVRGPGLPGHSTKGDS